MMKKDRTIPKVFPWICYILSAALILFYLLVLWKARTPDVNWAYQLYYIDKEIDIWPGIDGFDYTLGEVIQMEQEQKRCESGWGEIEAGGRWTQAGEAAIYFDKLPDKKLKLELVYSKPAGNTEIVISANGQTIWQEVKNTAVKEEKIQMVIDRGIVLDGRLKLSIICTSSRQAGILIKEVQIDENKD